MRAESHAADWKQPQPDPTTCFTLSERGAGRGTGRGGEAHETSELSNRGGTAVPTVSEILRPKGTEGDRPDEANDPR
jgi:hypothetical protein